MTYPLSSFAASPWKGDDTFAAGRPLLSVPDMEQAGFGGRANG